MPNFANQMPPTQAPSAPSMSFPGGSSPGGFDSILQFLGNLLTNKQSNQASQFGQEFGLQQQRQAQSAQAQQFGEAQQTKQTSLPYLQMMGMFQQQLASAKQPQSLPATLMSPPIGNTPNTNSMPYYYQPPLVSGKV